MSSSSVEVSFDTSALLDSCSFSGNDFLDPELYHGPTKKTTASNIQPRPYLLLSPESTPDLGCQLLFSSELFLMTQHLREGGHSGRNTSPLKNKKLTLDDDQGSSEERLRNCKIEKLIHQLSEDTSGDFEMDDELRSHVFTSRFQKKSFDAFDLHLDNFLQEPKKPTSNLVNNENKENLTSLVKPSKRKLADSAPKSQFRKKRPTPPLPKSSVANGMLPASMVNNSVLSLLQSPATKKVLETSPHRICVPRCVDLPKQPALKFRQNNSIFLVDSLTGSVNDATQFGTELNSSNCEGFPLPDDINEVVQIPTNTTGPVSSAPKMAIIKAIYSKRMWSNEIYENEKIGFYSKREFEELKLNANPQMTIYNDKKQVRWAEDLEW